MDNGDLVIKGQLQFEIHWLLNILGFIFFIILNLWLLYYFLRYNNATFLEFLRSFIFINFFFSGALFFYYINFRSIYLNNYIYKDRIVVTKCLVPFLKDQTIYFNNIQKIKTKKTVMKGVKLKIFLKNLKTINLILPRNMYNIMKRYVKN